MQSLQVLVQKIIEEYMYLLQFCLNQCYFRKYFIMLGNVLYTDRIE